MESLPQLADLFLHLDKHLRSILSVYGLWTYALLFLIIFLETGIVIAAFLPGDSLLFVAGTFAATGALNVWMLFALLLAAAVIGDTVNYWIGHAIGPRVFERDTRFLKKVHLDRTRHFFERHGGRAVVLARFIPMFRTVVPFVAGAGSMSYGRFIFYNISGGLIWTSLFIFGGYLFGSLPLVQEHFHLVIPALIGISLLPMGMEYRNHRKSVRASNALL